jgi:cytochrome b
MTQRILVWDVPTRLFHWLLALSFAGAFLTAESERFRDIHVLLGYTFAGLIGFRLVWGLVGTRYARFKSFRFGFAELRGYLLSLLTRSPRHYLGHNPAGAIAIFALLGLGIVVAVTGYAVYNDYGGEWIEELHEGSANAMLVVVFVHIAGAVVSSLLHRENLVRAMITGRKLGEPRAGIRFGHAWLGALLLAAVVGFWYAYPQLPPTSTEVAANATGHVPTLRGKRTYDDD